MQPCTEKEREETWQHDYGTGMEEASCMAQNVMTQFMGEHTRTCTYAAHSIHTAVTQLTQWLPQQLLREHHCLCC